MNGRTLLFDRSGERGRLEVGGRAPRQMLQGVLTGRIPEAVAVPPSSPVGGGATYSAALTPKGRIVSDLWVAGFRGVDGEYFELDVPEAGRAALLEHFGRYLPPRFAAVTDRTSTTGSIVVTGGAVEELLAGVLGPVGVPDEFWTDASEGDFMAWSTEDGLVRVTRSAELHPAAFEVAGPADAVSSIRVAILTAGAGEGSARGFLARRIEAGRPAFGSDMDESTMPAEAGIVERAIDHAKGCYTGQEVVVRIRDRGHANRHLRGLLFAGTAEDVPAPGTPLFGIPDAPERECGSVTSAAWSERSGGVIGLGYVRREVELPGTVRVGAADGPPARVRELGEGWWR